MSSNVIQLTATNPSNQSWVQIPKNLTGVYTGTFDPLHVAKVRKTVPTRPLKQASFRSDMGHEFNQHHGSLLFQPYTERVKDEANCRAISGTLKKTKKMERDLLCPQRKDCIRSADFHAINDLTRQNARNFTKSNNSGEKYYVQLSKNGEEQIVRPPLEQCLDTDHLADELKRSRRYMLGVEVCLRNVCHNNAQSLYTLLPKRRTPLPINSRASPRFETLDPIHRVGRGEILADLPQVDHRTTDCLRAHPTRPSLLRHFGQEEKIDQFHQRAFTLRTGRSIPLDRSMTGQQYNKMASRQPPGRHSKTPAQNFATRGVAWDKLPKRAEDLPEPCDTEVHSPPHPSRADTLHTRPTPASERPVLMSTSDTHHHHHHHEEDHVDIAVLDECGCEQCVIIDAPDDEATTKEEDLPNARKLSISDRVSRGRDSEHQAEQMRLQADSRRKELVELLEEHNEIVHEIDRVEHEAETKDPSDLEGKENVQSS